MRFLTFITITILSCATTVAQELFSPNKALKLSFSLSAEGTPTYSLFYKGKEVVKPSRLGIELFSSNEVKFGAEITKKEGVNTSLYHNFEVVNTQNTTVDETWQPVWGESQNIRNHYNELLVSLKQKDTHREMNLRFRLFDDGLGFRYEFPEQKQMPYFVLPGYFFSPS